MRIGKLNLHLNYEYIRRGFVHGFRYWYDAKFHKTIKSRYFKKAKRKKYGSAQVNKTYVVKKKILGSRTHGFCKICRKRKPQEELSVDHIIQLSKGGKGTRDNFQLLCFPCHKAKDNQKRQLQNG